MWSTDSDWRSPQSVADGGRATSRLVRCPDIDLRCGTSSLPRQCRRRPAVKPAPAEREFTKTPSRPASTTRLPGVEQLTELLPGARASPSSLVPPQPSQQCACQPTSGGTSTKSSSCRTARNRKNVDWSSHATLRPTVPFSLQAASSTPPRRTPGHTFAVTNSRELGRHPPLVSQSHGDIGPAGSPGSDPSGYRCLHTVPSHGSITARPACRRSRQPQVRHISAGHTGANRCGPRQYRTRDQHIRSVEP